MGFFKKRVDFIELLKSQCLCVVDGLLALKNYFVTADEIFAQLVLDIEKKGDLARRHLIDEINANIMTSIDRGSFFNLSGITPVERKDLHALSGLIDEVLDYAKSTVEEMRVFSIKANDDMIEIINVLLLQAGHIKSSIEHMNKDKVKACEEAVAAKHLENKVGSLSVKALAKLLDNQDLDYREIIKYREVYRHLNQTADIADDAMDVLLNILVSI